MIVPGLSAADSALYRHALQTDCEVAHLVRTLDLSHNLVGSIESVMLDGQINIVDGEKDGITRTMQAGFLDPDHLLRFDAGTPSHGMGGLDRLLQVRSYVKAPSWGFWLAAPTGTFRPSVVGRDGDTVTVEAQDKACLHLRKVTAYTLGKRMNTVTAIRRILAKSGENRFRFPANVHKTHPSRIHVGGPDDDKMPWKVAWRLARSIGYQLYYDTLGWACLRKVPTGVAWEFIEQGDGANTLGRVKYTTNLLDTRNQVIVTGHTKAQRKTKNHPERKSRIVTGTATASDAHLFSPYSLRINGTRWGNNEFYDEPTLKTLTEARRFANDRLNEWLTEKVDADVNVVPVWHLEARDKIRLRLAHGGALDFGLKNMSMPFGDNDSGGTIGNTSTVRHPSAGRLRKRR